MQQFPGDIFGIFICYVKSNKRIVCTFDFEDECIDFYNSLNDKFPNEYSWKLLSYQLLTENLSKYLDN